MISTALMIRIGRVIGNKMISMQINNNKLVNRGVSFIMDELKLSNEEALVLLNKYGLV
jgi:N-acetylmuramic acid 6-phosphate etherase